MPTTDEHTANAMCVYIVKDVLVDVRVLLDIVLRNTSSTTPSA